MLLEEPIVIKGIEIHNRLVMPPMYSGKSNADGSVNDDLIAYYADRVAGGAIGLVIQEHSFITEQGRASAGQVSLAENADIAGLKRIVDTVHAAGTKMVAQLNHAGSHTTTELTGKEVIGPSAIKNPTGAGDEPRALTIDEIHEIEDAFVAAALRVKEAGYDGVEIHSAHAYLLDQFYSPLSNKRTDEYGAQSVANRVRIHCEILQKVRKAVGEDSLVLMRFGGCDFIEGGATLADAAEAAPLLVAAGADVLDISGGMCYYKHPTRKDPGYFGETAKAVREVVDVPIILTGGIRTPEDAEGLLEGGFADMIGVGRALYKDPNWAREAMNMEA